MRCIYTGSILISKEGIKNKREILREFVFPKFWVVKSSYNDERDQPHYDLHQIFVSTRKIINNRGNKLLGSFQSSSFGKKQKCGIVFRKNNFSSFIPYKNEGTVARAILHMLIFYQNRVKRKYVPEKYLKWIQKTAKNSPVPLWEKQRNALIYKIQGIRNVFVDNPHLSDKFNISKIYHTKN